MSHRTIKSNRFRQLLFLFLSGLALLITVGFVLWGPLAVGGRSPILHTKGALPIIDPVKLVIAKDGIYQIDLIKLKNFGLDVSSTGLNNLEMTNIGKDQPFWVNQKTGMLYFYGRQVDSRYSRENVYILSPKGEIRGDGPITQPVSGASAASDEIRPDYVSLKELPGETYAAMTHLEENLVYNPMVVDGDNWLWESLLAPVKRSFDVNLNESRPGPGQLRLMLWGSTEASTSPDHHLIVRMNGSQVAEESWDGKGKRLIEIDVPASLMQEGRNQVEIELPGDTGAIADILFLDWVEFVYPRQFQAADDRLSFMSTGGTIKIHGFTGLVDIYDVTSPSSTVQVGQDVDPEAGFDSVAGHSYWVVGPGGKSDPVRTEKLVIRPDLRSNNNGADYLAIGAPELLESLTPLLEWRDKQGVKTMAAPIQAVYDQFNFGLPDPQAIRSLLAYTQENWARAPKYLALIGDASFDPKGYQTPPEANRVPTFLIQTLRGGETASDLGFAIPGNTPWIDTEHDGSAFAEVAVGRLPARNPTQVTDYVKKVISYEKLIDQFNPADPWQKRILAIADGADSSFHADAENLMRKVPDKYKTELLSPQDGEQDYGQVIKERLERGSWFVVYFGHGSINMWGKDKIFTRQDVATLHNYDRLPIMLHLTCLTGLFTHPKEESLAEAFIWQPNGGAIAVLAPTSLTLQEDQSFLSYAIEEEMVGDLDARIGDILVRARKTILVENPGVLEVLKTFMLFGDPALKIARFPNQ
jgi:hypothetical protein